MTQSVYEKFMQSIMTNDHKKFVQNFASSNLTDSDRQWGFYQAIIHNQYDIVKYMLEHSTDIGNLLISVYGNSLHYTAQQKENFSETTALIVSHVGSLTQEQQCKAFNMFVQFKNEQGALDMLNIVGHTTVYAWLENYSEWKSLLPNLMECVVLNHAVGTPSLNPTKARKI